MVLPSINKAIIIIITSKEPTIIYIQGLGPIFPKKVEFIPNGNKQPIIGVCKHVFAIIGLILP